MKEHISAHDQARFQECKDLTISIYNSCFISTETVDQLFKFSISFFFVCLYEKKGKTETMLSASTDFEGKSAVHDYQFLMTQLSAA